MSDTPTPTCPRCGYKPIPIEPEPEDGSWEGTCPQCGARLFGTEIKQEEETEQS